METRPGGAARKGRSRLRAGSALGRGAPCAGSKQRKAASWQSFLCPGGGPSANLAGLGTIHPVFFFILFLIKSFSEPHRGRYPEESGKYPAGAGSGACPYQAAGGEQTVALRADNRARFQRPKRAPARAELRAPTHPAHTPAYTPASLGLGVPAGAGRQRLGAGPGGGARLRRREVRALPSPGWIWAEQGAVSCGGSAGRHWALDMEGVVS